MGGTFDPIHQGHLVVANEARQACQLDEVVFVPAGQPWQKADRLVSSAEQRWLMTEIATATHPEFRVSRVDIDRPGPTYTIDTLRDLRQLHPEAELFFITGADALAQILSWRGGVSLFELAEFIGVTRPGHAFHTEGLPLDHITILDVPAMAISSTHCRQRIAAGGSVQYLVPEGVRQFIAKHGLYLEGQPADS